MDVMIFHALENDRIAIMKVLNVRSLLEFNQDYGLIYRFASEGEYSVTCRVSYCDENLRLADCDNEAEKAKEMP